MPRKLFVGGFSVATTGERLRAAFASAGVVESVTIATDHEGRSRGFGFVEMATEPAAREAVRRLNGQELDGRRLRVEFASPPGGHAPRRGSDEPARQMRESRGDEDVILAARHYCAVCDRGLVGYLLGRPGTELTREQREAFRKRLIGLHAKECLPAPPKRARS